MQRAASSARLNRFSIYFPLRWLAGGLLKDRPGTAVERYVGDLEMSCAADRLGAVVGDSFDEERIGTNAISVALEMGSPILVYSPEHYLTELQRFTCYGTPIVIPVTHRLKGVVDLMVGGLRRRG